MMVEISNIRRAIENNELVPHFQPLFQLRTGKIYGFEVLARWQHPDAGPILPPNFISLAEEHGLIGELTSQIFQKAFMVARDLPYLGRLSVNISPSQLTYLGLPKDIAAWASLYGFPLDCLKVEVTESALFQDLSKARIILHDLKQMGCRLALDDFGTGYSSLAHLQSLPFDQLKIDRSFVAGMTRKRESRKVVAAIIGLGHSLDMETLAEGIETEAQADMLLWLGCELGQGWLYGRAVPAEKIPGILSVPAIPAVISIPGPGEDWAVSSLEALPTQRLAQLQAIYEGAPVGLCFLDRKLRYVSLNQRLAERNGHTIAAHLGRTVAEMVPAMTVAFEPYLARALAGESISNVELARPGIDGAPDWTSLVSYQPAFDEADEVIGISIAVVDITEQKRVQDALHESEFVQRHMGELSRQIPWVMDPQGKNLQISEHWVKNIPGIKNRTRNLGWLEAVHPDDLERTAKAMRDALGTGIPIDIEYRIQTVDGEWRWVRSRGSPCFGDNGEIKRWYGSVEDIHASKLADTGLKDTYAKVRAALEAVPVVIVMGNTPASSGEPHETIQIRDSPSRQAKNDQQLALRLVVVDDVDHALSERNRLIKLLEQCHPAHRTIPDSNLVAS
jgi:PAS domain S-box-containing protein